MLKGFYVLMIPLLVLMSLTSCGGEEEWSEDFYTLWWSNDVTNCKEKDRTFTGSTDGYYSNLGDSPTKMTLDERNELAASSWFRKHGWSAIEGSHEWKKVLSFDPEPEWILEYSYCLQYLVTKLYVEPEEFFRCLWNEIESTQTEENWKYYSKTERESFWNEADAKCMKKFDRS